MEKTIGKNKFKVRDMALIALMTAAVSVLSIIAIPMPSGVPITLQTFAVPFVGYFLGAKKGTASIFLYLLIGAVGLPVFSGMKGGVSILLGPTGGFLWGFLIFVLLCGWKKESKNKSLPLLLGFAGLLICHALGALQYALLMTRPYIEAFLLVSLPYLVKDGICLVLAFLAAWQTSRILHKNKEA